MVRNMSMLPDDTYDIFILDANDDENANVVRLELTVTSGSHKGDVDTLRAANLARNVIDLIGQPAQLRVEHGVPTIIFD
jgi:hypothetical protein